MNKNQQQLTIAAIASEVDPYAKVGGLGDMTKSLAKALSELNHKVALFAPLYGIIETTSMKQVIVDQEFAIDDTTTITYSVWQDNITKALPVYFIEEQKHISKHKQVYGSGYDGRRFFVFDHIVLDALKQLNFRPNVIQCHDWQTGLVPYLLTHKYAQDEFYSHTASLYTINNLTFQSGNNWWEIAPENKDNGRGALPKFTDTEALENLNFAKRAIRNADMINAVSEQYAEEILTKKFGQELHRVLRHRSDRLVGIVNGIDYNEWNPATDPGLIANYDFNSLHNKTKNKVWLQEQLGLTVDPKIPMIAWTHRLAEQKGIELLTEIIDPLLRLDLQIVLLGAGDKKYEQFFDKIADKNPKKLFNDRNYIKTKSSAFEYNNQQETRLVAAADIYIMPSRFEPCGLGQLKSLRYGAIPVVHNVGGLADTIDNYKTRTGQGNGFAFDAYDSRDMLVALIRAIENHKHRDKWLALVRQAMRQSFSWEIPAQKYVELFRRAIRERKHR